MRFWLVSVAEHLVPILERLLHRFVVAALVTTALIAAAAAVAVALSLSLSLHCRCCCLSLLLPNLRIFKHTGAREKAL